MTVLRITEHWNFYNNNKNSSNKKKITKVISYYLSILLTRWIRLLCALKSTRQVGNLL